MKARSRLTGAAAFLAVAATTVGLAWHRHEQMRMAQAAIPVSHTPAVPCVLSLPMEFMPRYLAAVRGKAASGGTTTLPDGTDPVAELDTFTGSRLKKIAAALLAEQDLDHILLVENLGHVLQVLERKEPPTALAMLEEAAPHFNEADRKIIADAMLPQAVADAPEETADWWTRHESDFGSSASSLQDCLLTWAARCQPVKAFALLGRLHVTDLRSAGNGIGRAATTAEGWTATLQAMRAYLTELHDPAPAEDLRQGVMAGMGDSMVKQPFSEALAWMDKTLDPAEQHALAEGFQPGQEDSQQIAGWLDWLPAHLSPESVPAKIEALMTSWCRLFPEAAERWIGGSTTPAIKEAAVRGYVKQTAGNAPGNASRVAMLLPEGRSRDSMLRCIEDARTLRYGYLEERSDP